MIEQAIFWAGVSQLVLVIGSLAIPKVLDWAEDTSKLKPLTRQVFWTYAGYIWATNLSFAILSMASPSSLVDGSFLATAVTIYITFYWFARIVIQFTYFDRSDTPQGIQFVFAEILLVGLFVALVVIYGMSVWVNLSGANG